MKEIDKVKVVLAREVWGSIGTPIFPEGESGVFIDGKRLPVNAIHVAIDKDTEHLVVSIPMRIVELYTIEVPKKDAA